MLVPTGVNASFAGAPAVTVNVAAALVKPAALTVTVALPVVVAVRLDVATPAVAVTGEAGANVPDTPVTPKLMALVADVTVLPFAS